MIETRQFTDSLSLFDPQQCLIDWNRGFAEEFADAALLLVRSVNVGQVRDACLLPERALDLSWATRGEPPHIFEYINNRECITVVQEVTANGNILRLARRSSAAPQLHPAMLDHSTDLLRSAALQISASILKRRDQEHVRLKELALTDGLTGVANRRYFEEMLINEWQRCRRNQSPLSVIFIDVDHFKRFNDLYGHLKGDGCLKAIASTIRENFTRPGDVVARYGGEEFTCLLPETDLPAASHIAEKIQLAVRSLNIPHGNSKVAPVVTISLGVATAELVVGDDSSALVSAADQSLYAAKASGRGRVCATTLPLQECPAKPLK